MKPPFALTLSALSVPALVLYAVACGGGDDMQPPGGVQGTRPATSGATAASDGGPEPSAPATAAAADAGADGAPAAAAVLALPLREFQERDFAETPGSRDPFRSFALVFAAQAPSRTTLQRKVLVDHYSLEELKLVGIVTRAQPRALLTDPNGYGWVAKVGEFVGKAELVHSGGPTGADVPVNWRVDRIREGDVVFIREDPSHPEIPPTTRVVSLRTPEEQAAQQPRRR